MKKPVDCTNKDDIRCAIDKIDKEIIKLLGERFKYVQAIVKFKEADKESIVAQKRYDAVIQSRCKWAKEEGLNPVIIEKMYTNLLNDFIQEEMNMMNNMNNHTK